jgi:hypothetical protein
VQAYLSAHATAHSIEVGQLVNELLKKDIQRIEAAPQGCCREIPQRGPLPWPLLFIQSLRVSADPPSRGERI